jgi:hypothetical protein
VSYALRDRFLLRQDCACWRKPIADREIARSTNRCEGVTESVSHVAHRSCIECFQMAESIDTTSSCTVSRRGRCWSGVSRKRETITNYLEERRKKLYNTCMHCKCGFAAFHTIMYFFFHLIVTTQHWRNTIPVWAFWLNSQSESQGTKRLTKSLLCGGMKDKGSERVFARISLSELPDPRQ